MAVAAIGVLYFVLTINPIYRDPAMVPSTAADSTVTRYEAAIDKSRNLARAMLAAENVPGLSVAVAMNGEIAWAEGFGYADVERRTAMTPDMRFPLGSVSKTLTAVGVALLHDRGRLDLDAPVQTYLPAYPQKAWTITSRELMGDVAGVHCIRGDNNDLMPFGRCASLGDAVAIFADEPLLFDPGTNYRFGTHGWILLSAVIEAAAAEPFGTFMRRDVFQPLGMTRTALQGTGLDDQVVSVYAARLGSRPSLGLQPASTPDYSCFAGAGAFFSTPSDLVRLASATMTPGLLAAGTIAMLQEPQRLKSGASTGFSLGWKVDETPLGGVTTRVLRHRATPFGSAILVTMFPDRQLAIAAAVNVSYLSAVDTFAGQVAEIFSSAR
jgi:CubicO group peptidase (beta-lactamase class C family)